MAEEPQLGNYIRAKELWPEKTWNHPLSPNQLYIYTACPDCGKRRWVKNGDEEKSCRSCSSKAAIKVHGHPRTGKHLDVEARLKIGQSNTGKPKRFTETQRESLRQRAKKLRWNGGKTGTYGGYIAVRVYPDEFFFPMANKHGYILEHRLVMAKNIKRCLLPWEIVHHFNGIKADNRIENLRLLKCAADHLPSQAIQALVKKQSEEIKELQARVTLLEAELTLLRSAEATSWQKS